MERSVWCLRIYSVEAIFLRTTKQLEWLVMRLFNPECDCWSLNRKASSNIPCFFHEFMPYSYCWPSFFVRNRNVRYQESKIFGGFKGDWV